MKFLRSNGTLQKESNWGKWSFLIGYMVWILVFPTKYLIEGIIQTDGSVGVSTWINPDSRWLRIILTHLVEFPVSFAPCYALVFTVFGGLCFLEFHDGLSQLLCLELEYLKAESESNRVMLIAAGSLNTNNGNGRKRNAEYAGKPRFAEQFRFLRNSFAIFEGIVGWHLFVLSVAVFGELTLGLFGVCGSVLFQEATSGSYTVGNTVENIILMLLLVCFAEFAKDEVSEHTLLLSCFARHEYLILTRTRSTQT